MNGEDDEERIHGDHRARREMVHRLLPRDPRANGQGRTKAEARRSLAEAIALILEDRRKDGLRGVPPGAVREKVTVR